LDPIPGQVTPLLVQGHAGDHAQDVLLPGVNFIKVLGAAFAQADSKSAKRLTP